MANELPRAFRDALGDSLKELAVQVPCDDDAERSVRRPHAGLLYCFSEWACKFPQNSNLGVTLPELFPGPNEISGERLERITDRTYPTSPSSTQYSLQNGGEHVRVFVRVDMRYINPAGLQFTNLRGRLGLDLMGIDSPGEGLQSKHADSGAKMMRLMIGNERWQPRWINQRLAIDEYDMATHAPVVARLRQQHGFVIRTGVRHQRCRGDNATRMTLGNRPVHTMGQSEVVGIDDKAAHAKSLAG